MSRKAARVAMLAAVFAASTACSAAAATDDEVPEDADAAPEQAEHQPAKAEKKPYKRPAWLEKLDRFADYLHEQGILVPADGAARPRHIPYFVIPEQCITPDRRVRTDTELCRLWNQALAESCRTRRYSTVVNGRYYSEGKGYYWDFAYPRCQELHRRIRELEHRAAAERSAEGETTSEGGQER